MMASNQSIGRAEAFQARLARLAPDMVIEPAPGEFGAIATYEESNGRRIFSFCLDGLLIDPDGEARYVPYTEILKTSYHGVAELRAEKHGQMSRDLALILKNGETFILHFEERGDRLSERLRVGGLIEQRLRLARADFR